MSNPTPNPPNASLNELKAIRRELSDLKSELSALRSDLGSKKPLNITDQVAKGVVIGGIFLVVIFAFLQIIFARS
jgi:cell shape-determining protein MreC